jgi:hypothetical protein
MKILHSPQEFHGRARELLSLDSITVVYPGDKDYALADNIHVRGFRDYLPCSGK